MEQLSVMARRDGFSVVLTTSSDKLIGHDDAIHILCDLGSVWQSHGGVQPLQGFFGGGLGWSNWV